MSETGGEEYVKENHVSKLKSCIETISFVLSIQFEHDFNSKAKIFENMCVIRKMLFKAEIYHLGK